MSYSPEQYRYEKEVGLRKKNGAVHLTKLTGKHLRAINFHLAGMKAGQICSIMNITPGWLSTVLNDPLSKDMIQKRFVETDQEMFAKATRVIDEKMDEEDPAIALRAAEMVWRSRGKFEKKVSDAPTAEDIVARMLEMARTNGSASIKVEVGPQPAPYENTHLLLEGEAA